MWSWLPTARAPQVWVFRRFLSLRVLMGIFWGMAFQTDSLHITRVILALMSEIDEFKGAWRALGTLAEQVINRV